MKILLIQGANMEYLGLREPELYGRTTAAELEDILHEEARGLDVDLEIRTTNIEGEAIGWIYEAARGDVDSLVMNPAGFLYSGYALRDCLKAVELPYVEVHMTNIDSRGMRSVTATECIGMISGFGVESYRLALRAAIAHHASAASGA